tara:strand:- start:38 stop:643 length:606 start_codon:yes stop_codon:yes gene_type:complete
MLLNEQCETRSRLKFHPAPEEALKAVADIGARSDDAGSPVTVLSISKADRPDRVRLEIEICLPLVELLARAAACFHPLIGQVEAEREAEQRKAESLQRIRERQARALKAGRWAYHRCRKVSAEQRHEALLRIARQLDLCPQAVVLFRKAHKKWFDEKLRQRRIKSATRLYWEGKSDGEIAAYLRVSIGTARRYWGGDKRLS